MKQLLLVVSLTESFSALWESLASAVDAELRVAHRIEDVAGLGTSAVVLLVVAGEEHRAREAMERLRVVAPVDLAVVGASTDHRLVSSLLRGGASDYFALPADLSALHAWIDEHLRQQQAELSARSLVEEQQLEFDFSRLVGTSPALRGVLQQVSLLIPVGSATVLITGETGTGKDLIAQAIHYNSPRAHREFVEINCTALPPHLIEAELFGYEPGAFTDARRSKPGLIEIANGGTLFLDEIGDLPLDLQAKLLRVIESKRTRRVGSVTSVQLDVRIIAATHVDLAARVREGRFRQDLYYRLNVLPVHLPPLRERASDIVALAEHFARRFAEEYGFAFTPVPDEARAALLAHSWPGNVRELRNVIERAFVLGRGKIRVENLTLGLGRESPARGWAFPFPVTLAEIQAAAARAAVERCGGNKSRAAKMLGISRKGLYALLGSQEEAEPGSDSEH
ncbi:MAG TPA: sigma-54 dependent transcriptional regulator [Longimicrobiaceae bacterium]|nr:sigma-54 dependent transcriptional regulator [Longimicrobiaceae bacterium]